MKLTANFLLEEFNCKDGTMVPDHLLENVRELAENLQVLRNFINAPIHINSAYRTTEYNASVGGKEKSQHLIGKAADITTQHLTPRQLARIIEQLINQKKMKQGGLGIYPGFVHYDCRGTLARW